MADDDINLVISAQDEASAQIDKIEEEMGEMFDTLEDKTEGASKSNKNLGASLKKIGGILTAVAAAAAGWKLADFLFESSELFDIQADAMDSLRRQMEAAGGATQKMVQDQYDLASALQEVANIGDEATLVLMKQASQAGVWNQNIGEVTASAIGLAERLGISVEQATSMTADAVRGNAGAFAAYIPELRFATTNTEALELISKRAAEGLGMLEEKQGSAAGTATKLSNSWGDLKEEIGRAIAPFRILINSVLQNTVVIIQGALIPAIDAVAPAADRMAAAVARGTRMVITAITMIEVTLMNLPKVWEIVKTSAALQITRMVNIIIHFFTVAVPTYIVWFADNFVNILTDAFNIVVISFTNAAKNIAGAFTALWDWIKSGMEGGTEELFRKIGERAGRGLLDGFKAQTEALPEIAQRQISGTELILQESLNRQVKDLTDEADRKIAERLAMLDREMPGLNLKGLKNQFEGGARISQVGVTESRLLTRGRTQLSPQEQAVELLRKIDRNTSETAENTYTSPGEAEQETLRIVTD